MAWSICSSCGLIQLAQLLPLGLLYPVAHGSGVVGGTWRQHHAAFARFLEQFQPTSVLEIGGSHGLLSVEYHRIADIPWHIVEPNPMPVPDCRATFTKGFFGADSRFEHGFDMVVHSHVFEHIYHPRAFLADLRTHLAAGTTLCFTLPNMQVMLERNYSNCLNFEHTLFLTEPYIEYMLAAYGFELLRKEYFLEDHSIFYAAQKFDDIRAAVLPQGLYSKNRKTFTDYAAYYRRLVQELNVAISQCPGEVYLFGGHVFSQALLAFGLETQGIVGILDNDPEKRGKRLCGTDLFVESPVVLSRKVHPVVILKAGAYSAEIRADILRNINPDTVFLG
jgi:hypothetical protein